MENNKLTINYGESMENNKLTAVTEFSTDYENFDIRKQPKFILEELQIFGDVPDEVIDFIDNLRLHNISLFRMMLPAGLHFSATETDDPVIKLQLHAIVAQTKSFDEFPFEKYENQSIFLYIFPTIDGEVRVRYAGWVWGKVAVDKSHYGYIPITPENTAYVKRETKLMRLEND